jgi:alginate O-acetyltransferase complex protein AlgJ
MRRKHLGFVHVGRDGWLFLIGGTNGVLEQYRATFARWRLLRGWRRLIEARAARAQALGIRYLHVIVPEKLSVYDDRTGDLDYNPRRSPARALAKRLINNPAFVDLLAPLRAARDGPVPLYYRTDTHWNYDGCLLAYRVLMRACGAVPPANLDQRERYETTQLRDLGEKVPGTQPETANHGVIDQDARRVYASPLVEAYESAGRAADLHVGAHVRFRNESPRADPRTVVLFGDSYAHFAPIMLSGLIAETFREVHFVWSSSIDWAYVAAVKPDLLLFEIAERFIVRLPDDGFDIATYQKDEHLAEATPTPPASLAVVVPEGLSAEA